MNYLYDTNIIIYFLKGEPAVSNYFEENFIKSNNIFIASITRIELLSFPDIDSKEENKINNFLNEFNIIYLSKEIEDEVIKIKRQLNIRLPDSIILATAKNTSSILITRNINDYKSYKFVQIINPFD